MIDLRNTMPLNPGEEYPTRGLDEITHIIAHHSATVQGSAVAFANFHIRQYGWPGIAYHYVIDKRGTIYKTLDHHKVGYHCKGMNRKSIGVCLVGNFDMETVPDVEFEALLNLVVGLRRFNDWEVGFHFEYSRKTCPGYNFPHQSLWDKIEYLENSASHIDADEFEPDTTMTGPGIDEESPPVVSPPVTMPPTQPITNDKSQNPGCLFSIF